METSKYSLKAPNISAHGFGSLHPPLFDINNNPKTSHVALNVNVLVGMGVHNMICITIPMKGGSKSTFGTLHPFPTLDWD